MKDTACPPRRGRCRALMLGAASLPLVPLVVWSIVVLAAPTGWARDRVARRLGQASGRAVKLDGLHIGFLGGISLKGLTIGAPGSADDPWLSVSHASIDVSLRQLLCSQVEPTQVEVDGATLRVLRRSDGTLELHDFLRRPGASGGPEDEAAEPECPGVAVHLTRGIVTLIDEPTGSRAELRDVEARAVWRGKVAALTDLTAAFNGGTVALAAQVDRTEAAPAFEGQLKLRDVELDARMGALAYLLPVLSGAESTLRGRLGLDLYARGKGDARKDLRTSVVGHGQITLDPIQLDGSRLLDQVGQFVEVPAGGRVGSVRADLAIRDGRIASDNLTLDLGRVPVVLSGWTDFDGRVNYRLRSDSLVERLPARARDWLAEMDVDLERATDLRFDGTIDELAVSLDGVPLNEPNVSSARPTRDEQLRRLRAIGRQLRDRIRR